MSKVSKLPFNAPLLMKLILVDLAQINVKTRHWKNASASASTHPFPTAAVSFSSSSSPAPSSSSAAFSSFSWFAAPVGTVSGSHVENQVITRGGGMTRMYPPPRMTYSHVRVEHQVVNLILQTTVQLTVISTFWTLKF